ncbi:putative polysaccharide biosynthesis protein [Metabacillus rhizolycopersici]|uniref:Oligosaccharide flippase family protein n=1 Tax=Metabacillus rhizolycopersici TaxID=2875709 RepID=A0ABS7USH8_9BACI|nr:oligosaccharide flippase family protein [Metabacillus rhizolycopersici]MBZ5751174.1 oligosaccharide flippase family protein [Metabacillus rhizolycopersici]
MNVQKNSINLAMQGAVILTIAGLITKILSAAYRVPYQNIVGDIGFYIYQQVYPFYGMGVILATSGFPVMISKVMTDYGYGKSLHIKSKIMTITFLYLTIIGVVLSATLYIFSDNIAAYMGDSNLTALIQVTSIALLVVPIISIFRGYFQFEQNMQPTAISQIIEQSIRVSVILVSSYYMVRAGYNLYEAGFGALVGSIVGSVAGLILLLIFWIRKKQHTKIRWNISAPIETWKILTSLIKYSWTIALSSLLLILIQLIDALNLYSLLIGGGMGEVLAKETKGVYDRGQPLIQLGTVVATSLALSLVPVIASAKFQNNSKLIHEKVNLSLKVCIVVGAGAATGLIAIIRPTNIMLFTNASGSNVLMILSASILFTSLCLTMFAILQGLGYTFFPALSVLIGVGAKYLANIWLIPLYGVSGAAVSTVLSYCLIAILTSLFMMVKGYSFKEKKCLVKISLALVMMFLIICALLTVVGSVIDLDNRLNATFASFFGVVVGGSLYGWLIIKLNVFSRNELQYIPIAKKGLKKEKWGS